MQKYLKLAMLFLFLTIAFAGGCRKADNPSAPSTAQERVPTAAGKKYLLPQEPSGSKSVLNARKDAKDGEDIVLVGRIGGDAKPWVEGRASFWIVDTSLKSCKETEDDNCPTPWDYCCIPRNELTAAMATVKIVDETGQTIPTDARELLGVKELQTIVVRGRARRDESGNLIVLASGIFLRPDGNKQ
jgi:hypothetical protein